MHAALAYTSFSTIDETHWVKSSAPIVDSYRCFLLDPLVFHFDTFLMSLLFLISGLFTLRSIERRGCNDFFIARLKRLGVPFVFAVLVIAPLAFYPSYLSAAPETDTPYLFSFFTSDGWPTGPPWFLWVLLLFNGIVAFVHWLAPNLLRRISKLPSVFIVFLVSILSFLPLSLIASHFWWLSIGPIDMQPVRLGLYFAYFLLGMAIGAGQGWRRRDWLKNWSLWLVVGVLSFVVYLLLLNEAVQLPGLVMALIFGTAFAVSCAGTSLGLLGAFRRYAGGNYVVFDSLSENSYGIYIIHYAFVIWIQFLLFEVSWPACFKFCVTFVGGLLLSWGTSIALRKIPAIRQII